MISHDAAWTQVSAANEELELDLSPRITAAWWIMLRCSSVMANQPIVNPFSPNVPSGKLT